MATISHRNGSDKFEENFYNYAKNFNFYKLLMMLKKNFLWKKYYLLLYITQKYIYN